MYVSFHFSNEICLSVLGHKENLNFRFELVDKKSREVKLVWLWKHHLYSLTSTVLGGATCPTGAEIITLPEL